MDLNLQINKREKLSDQLYGQLLEKIVSGELKEGDKLRGIMEEKFSREVIMTYLDMSRKDLNDLLKECNRSDRFIRKASDLQVIEAVLQCYDNYRAVQEGKVQKDIIRVNNNQGNN